MPTRKLKYEGAFFWIFLICVLYSCRNQGIRKLEEVEGKYRAKIEVSAGDHIDKVSKDTLNFVNYPFNIGVPERSKNRRKKIIILGKRMRIGQTLGVKPVAKVSYQDEDGNLVEMIVARPIRENLITAKVDSYFELLSVHYGIQKMIDTWILYSEGLGKTSDIKWESEDKAIELYNS